MEVRPGYKQTEVGVIPEDWGVYSLGEIGTFKNGINKDSESFGYGSPFVNLIDVFGSTTITSTDNLALISSTNFEKSKYDLKRGDVIFVRSSVKPSGVGLTTVVQNDLPEAVFSGFLIRFRDNGFIDINYKKYCFYEEDFRSRVIANSTVSANTNINQESLRNILLAIPTLAEQKAIAESLSDADALIEALERLIAKKRQIKQGAMEELLTGKRRLPGFSGEWEDRNLGELGATYGGLTGKTKADFGRGSAKYIPFLNIMNNVIIDVNQLEPVNILLTEKQHSVREGDLFFNSSSETPEEVGMCSVLLEDIEGVYLNSFCFGFRLYSDARANGLFLAYLIRSDTGRKLLYSLAQGATRHNLSKTALLDLEFRLPDLKEQIAISRVLFDIDAEITELEEKLGKLHLLKQGMMQELLTGRIRLV